MVTNKTSKKTNLIDDYLLTWIEAFLIDRHSRGVTKVTVVFYAEMLKLFTDFCKTKALTLVTQITPGFIREYLIWLEDGHNTDGIHIPNDDPQFYVTIILVILIALLLALSFSEENIQWLLTLLGFS